MGERLGEGVKWNTRFFLEQFGFTKHVFSSQVHHPTQRLLRRAATKEDFTKTSPVDQLADRELEAFGLIGRGFSTRNIAARMHISPKTVERYRENIKKKLGIATSSELIHHATLWVEQNR